MTFKVKMLAVTFSPLLKMCKTYLLHVALEMDLNPNQ